MTLKQGYQEALILLVFAHISVTNASIGKRTTFLER